MMQNSWKKLKNTQGNATQPLVSRGFDAEGLVKNASKRVHHVRHRLTIHSLWQLTLHDCLMRMWVCYIGTSTSGCKGTWVCGDWHDGCWAGQVQEQEEQLRARQAEETVALGKRQDETRESIRREMEDKMKQEVQRFEREKAQLEERLKAELAATQEQLADRFVYLCLCAFRLQTRA